jgi:hypothetical protein
MSKPRMYAYVLSLVVILVLSPRLTAQDVGFQGSTSQGDAGRSMGRFLRGMAWYELGSAQARAIDMDTIIAWNQAVQTSYNRDLQERARRFASRKAARNAREQEVAKVLAETQRRWREDPTVDDIRSGLALHALASDLADPKIPPARWRNVQISLPDELSIRTLVFRFADAPRSKLPGPLAPSTVAVGRMKVDGGWPIFLRRDDMERDRKAYERGVAAVIAKCEKGKPLQAADVDSVRNALFSLKEKVAGVAVPDRRGLVKQANDFLDQLDEATKIFWDRDIAEELIRDVERHKAKSVGELLGFMKKYRLLFAEADANPDVWRAYQTLYDLLKTQKTALELADPPEELDEVEKPEPKSR